MDLLVSYEWGWFGRAKREILTALQRFGDERARVERTRVKGIALVHTAFDGREVVRRCRQLFHEEFAFEHATKWVPVDYWCDTDLESLRKLLAETVCPQIAANETWAMQVEKRRWGQYHTRDIIAHLAPAIDRRVDLDRPDKLVHLDVVDGKTAVSVLRPGDFFAIAAPELPATPAAPSGSGSAA
jgi:tRNA acetyltransferase TAN1